MNNICRSVVVMALVLVLVAGVIVLTDDSDAAKGDTFSYDGLDYKALSDEDNTVSVTGIASGNGDTSITIPNQFTYNGTNYKVTEIGSSAFKASSITSIVLPEGLLKIGSSAFAESDITSISLPEGLQELGYKAFADCADLAEVTIPASVTTISSSVFSNTGLKEATIPADPQFSTTLFNLFGGCTNLTKVNVGDSTKYSVVTVNEDSNFVLSNDGSVLEFVPRGISTGITVPDTVTSIASSAIGNASSIKACSSLTSIVFPSSLKTLPSGVLYNCSGLISVTLPSGLTEIPYNCFMGCSSLTTVNNTDSVTSIGSSAFSGCTSLTSLSFSSMTSPPQYPAFSGCNDLSVTIGNHVYAVDVDGNLTEPEIVSDGVVYPNIQNAVNAAPDGIETTIDIEADITLSQGTNINIPENKSIVIDATGHTVTLEGNLTSMISNYGSLEITGGTFVTEESALISNYGDLTITDGTFQGKTQNVLKNDASGTTVIEGGSFSNTGYPCIANSGDMTITGGTFSNTSCSTCNIDTYQFGYTISTTGDLSIDEATENGVTVIGTRGTIGVSAGTVTIDGGSYTVETPKCGNSHTINYYAVYAAGEDAPVDVTIYSGEFKGDYSCAILAGNSNDGGMEASVSLTIYGGDFSTNASGSSIVVDKNVDSGQPDVRILGGTIGGYDASTLEEYISEDMTVNDQNQVVPKEDISNPVAYVGNQPFSDIQAAVAFAVSSNADVEVCSTIALDGELDLGKATFVRHNGFEGTMFHLDSSDDRLVMNGATIDGKNATLSGNGYPIKADAGTIELNDVRITGNTVTSIYASHSNVIMSGCEVTGNEESGHTYGTVFLFNSSATITGCSITANTVTDHGSALRIQNTDTDVTITISDTVISGNTCGGNGAVYALADNNTVTIFLEDVTISGNSNDTGPSAQDVFTTFIGSTDNSPKITLRGTCDIGGMVFLSETNGVKISENLQVESGFALADPDKKIRLSYGNYDDNAVLIIGDGADPSFFDLGLGDDTALEETENGLTIVTYVTVTFYKYNGSEKVQVRSGEAIPADAYPESDRTGFGIHHWYIRSGAAWDENDVVTGNLSLWPYWEYKDGSVSIDRTDSDSGYILTAVIPEYAGTSVSYRWSTGETTQAITVSDSTSSGPIEYKVTVTFTPDKSWIGNKVLTASYSPDMNKIVFSTPFGILNTIYVEDGATVGSDQFPSVDLSEGYVMNGWTVGDTVVSALENITSDMEVIADLSLTDPVIESVTLSGSLNDGGVTVTVTATHPVDDVTFVFAFGPESAEDPDQSGVDNTYAVYTSGTYAVIVMATDSYGVTSGVVGQIFSVDSEPSPLPPVWDDDDDPYIPPSFVVQESDDSDDEAVKVVACAAAAVVAAILATFLIFMHRKN